MRKRDQQRFVRRCQELIVNLGGVSAEDGYSWELSTPGILDEYGNPAFGEFLVAESPADDVRNFVLYDFDQGNVASSHVFDTYEEAAEAAAPPDNVIIMPLRVPRQS